MRRLRGRFHPHRILIVALVIVVIGAAATLFGWDISGWFKHLWNAVTAISIGYLLAGIVLITLQTTTTAYAWYSILRYGYPDAGVRWVQILACYAAAVALNSVLPANLGTLAMLLMFTTIIARRELRRDPRRAGGAEDLLHADRDVRLPVPVPDDRRVVRPAARVHLGPPAGHRDPRRGSRGADLPGRADLARADQRVVGRGEGRGPDPHPTEGLLRAGAAPRGDQLRGDARDHRGVPGRVQHSR